MTASTESGRTADPITIRQRVVPGWARTLLVVGLLYLFLVGHPDVVVNIWEVLGVTKLKLLQAVPDDFQVIDSVGTSDERHFADLGIEYYKYIA